MSCADRVGWGCCCAPAGLAVVVDAFQYTNYYALTPRIHELMNDVEVNPPRPLFKRIALIYQHAVPLLRVLFVSLRTVWSQIRPSPPFATCVTQRTHPAHAPRARTARTHRAHAAPLDAQPCAVQMQKACVRFCQPPSHVSAVVDAWRVFSRIFASFSPRLLDSQTRDNKSPGWRSLRVLARARTRKRHAKAQGVRVEQCHCVEQCHLRASASASSAYRSLYRFR
jgi:hypothetical protein